MITRPRFPNENDLLECHDSARPGRRRGMWTQKMLHSTLPEFSTTSTLFQISQETVDAITRQLHTFRSGDVARSLRRH